MMVGDMVKFGRSEVFLGMRCINGVEGCWFEDEMGLYVDRM